MYTINKQKRENHEYFRNNYKICAKINWPPEIVSITDSVDKTSAATQTGDALFLIILLFAGIIFLSICLYTYYIKNNKLKNNTSTSITLSKSKLFAIPVTIVLVIICVSAAFFMFYPTHANANSSNPSINKQTNYTIDTQKKTAICDTITINNAVPNYKFSIKSIDLKKIETSINFKWKLMANDKLIYNNEDGESKLDNPIIILPGTDLKIQIDSSVSYDETLQLVNKDIVKITFVLDKIVDGSLIKVAGKESFEAGTINNLHIDFENNIHSLAINNNQTTGTFTSDEIHVDNFEKLLCTWSSSFTESNQVEI